MYNLHDISPKIMPDFLRKPRSGIHEGDTFTDIQHGEVIAQVCVEGKCLEVRKSLKDKNGKRIIGEERKNIIESAKAEVLSLPAKKKEKAKSTKKK